MKRLTLLAFLSLSLCFFSCNQNNDVGGNGITEDPVPVLKSLKIYTEDIDISKLEMSFGKDKTQVTSDDVEARFDWGKERDKKIEVEVANGSLQEGDNTIKLSVKAIKGQYKAWEQNVKIIIKKAFDLKLEELIIHGEKAKIDGKPYTCTIDSKHKNIVSDDIKATFKVGSNVIKVIPLTVENCPTELPFATPTTIRLIAPESENEYNKWEHDIVITRKALPPQIPSVVTEFVVNDDFYETDEVKKEKTFPSNVKKPVVLLATNRVFSKIESTAFKVEYPDQYKKDATLTFKEDLVYGTPVAVSIDVTTKEANQDRDDLPIKLEFSLTLKKGEIKITSISIGDIRTENKNGTLNISTTPSEIQMNFTVDSVIGLCTSIVRNDDGSVIKGNIYGTVATFPSIALKEGINEFVAKVSAENAEPDNFPFKVNYKKL